MSIAVHLALIVVSVGGLLAAMAGVKVLAKWYDLSAELQRKIVHVATGLYALTLPLTFGETWPVLLLSAIAVLVLLSLRLPAIARSGIGSTIHGVERQSYGEILLAISVGFLFFRSIGTPVLFVLPILVLTFSDAVAALTGVNYGRKLFPVENGVKSLEGVAMFFLITFILAMVTLLLMTDIPRQSAILLSLIVAVFGAQIEADSWRGFDNFFVPVGVHLFLQNNLDVPPVGLLGAGLLYIAILMGLLAAAPRLGLSGQAARGCGVLVFLILSVTTPANAVLPLTAFGAFLVLRRAISCRRKFPELDFLAAAAGAAAWWLFAGEWSGHNAINLYNLTFAGVAASFAVLALRNSFPGLAVVVAAVVGLAVYSIQFLNLPEARWIPAFAPVILVSLAISVTAAFWAPDAFERYLAGRAFIVAMIVPLTVFGWKVLLS
ncbi:MAG: diacylglycerol/polyprenol kinase family protein [Hyphomicrobiaceae bacterium]